LAGSALPDAAAAAFLVAGVDGEAEGGGDALGDGLAGADVAGADGDGVPAVLA
jgi:hypothetical protein